MWDLAMTFIEDNILADEEFMLERDVVMYSIYERVKILTHQGGSLLFVELNEMMNRTCEDLGCKMGCLNRIHIMLLSYLN
jgi:hypothetical protein